MAVSEKKFSIYRARDAKDVTEEVMPLMDEASATDQAGLGTMIEHGLLEGAEAKALFEDEAAGISLVHNWFKPNYPLPRHSHNADCLYYVVSGEARMGHEVFRAGDGFFMPANQLYHFEVGAEGVEVLEFRTAARFNVKFKTAEAMWAKLLEKTVAARPQWADAEPPLAVKRMAGQD